MEIHSEQKPLKIAEALDFAKPKPPLGGFWTVLISSFIAVYFTSVIVWLFAEIPYQSSMAPISHFINIADGGVQHWSLFSPDVRHRIYHETATVSFRDGTMKLYEFPRMEKMSNLEKFKHEKLRKLFSDNIPWPGYESFLPSVCQYLAASNQDSDNQPAMMTMTFNYTDNPAPDPDHWNYRDKLPFHTDKETTFVYAVRERDFVDESLPKGISSTARQTNLRVVDTR